MDMDHSQSEEDMDMSDDDLENIKQAKQTSHAIESKSDPAYASDAEGDDDDMVNITVIPGSSSTGRRRNVVGESDADEQEEEEEEEEENEDDDELEGQEDELSHASSRSSSPMPSPASRRRESESVASSPAKRPSFKIRLKLPTAPSVTTTRAPSDDTRLPSNKRRLSRDIESEDSNEDEDSTRSASVAGLSRMTHRQAALAGVVERTELVSLDDPNIKKKKHLNEAELALKREETARKRKNLSEKKLADEKTETINRLLKKQSRARNKRSALATADPDEEPDPDAIDDTSNVQTTPLPTLYRWISSNKEGIPTMSLSIPAILLPDERGEIGAYLENIHDKKKMCDVPGCRQPMKYKLIKHPTLGGCSLSHWKALQVE